MSYGWMITEDELDGTKFGTDLMGPANITPEMKQRLKDGEGEEFEMDDNENEAL